MQEYTFDTVIVGTGCAGYNCADWLYTLGRRDPCHCHTRAFIGRLTQHGQR